MAGPKDIPKLHIRFTDRTKGLIKDGAGRSMTQENLDELITLATEMELTDAAEAGALGFMAHHLVQTTLPHSKLVGADGQELREFSRHNGHLHLGFQSGLRDMPGTGIPYGVWPRRILIHIATEAKRIKTPEIDLGASMEEFAVMLGVQGGVGWGKRGVGTEIQRQATRLFTGSLTTWTDDNPGLAFDTYRVADSGGLWWDVKHPAQKSFWRSSITLSSRAFREMTQRAIPFDQRALKDPTMRRSPLALDLLIWLPYRCYTARKHILVPWWPLMRQFGTGYAENPQGMRNFRKEVRLIIKIILGYWPRLKVDASGVDGVWITPGPSKMLAGNPVG